MNRNVQREREREDELQQSPQPKTGSNKILSSNDTTTLTSEIENMFDNLPNYPKKS